MISAEASRGLGTIDLLVKQAEVDIDFHGLIIELRVEQRDSFTQVTDGTAYLISLGKMFTGNVAL